MKTLELKSNIHKIVEEIQSEQLLQSLYDFLRTWELSKPGELWNSLTNEQKQEVLLSYDESEDEANLINRESIFRRSK